MLRIFIAEDEKGTLNTIHDIVENYCKNTKVIGTATDVESSVKFLSKNKVDLVLFDINFPDGTGFDILNQLETYNFKVIFITAYEKYAIKAIKFSAVDYLLKPINPKELIDSIKKTHEEIIKNTDYPLISIDTLLSNLKNDNKKNKKIVLKTHERIHVVEIKAIIRCESDRSYTTFFMDNGQKIILSKNLIEFDELLSEFGFLRIHKSHLVNIDSIVSFEKTGGGFLIMADKSKIPVSVRKRDYVLKAIEKL